MSTRPSAHSAPASLTPAQGVVVALLRMAIGCHFLYEGVVKIVHKGWTSAEYLAQARGWWAGGFDWIAAHASVLHVVDAANIAALTLGGLALMFGLFTRAASAAIAPVAAQRGLDPRGSGARVNRTPSLKK